MILKGNRRGGAKDLAIHLMKPENDHVEVQELRGFVAGNLMGALNETYAISRGTRCQKFLYSMSVNPPPGETATTADILDAIEKSEKLLNLSGQPRAIVFHEKEGRRHAHVVWSLINAAEMKAVRLRNDRTKPMSTRRWRRRGVIRTSGTRKSSCISISAAMSICSSWNSGENSPASNTILSATPGPMNPCATAIAAMGRRCRRLFHRS